MVLPGDKISEEFQNPIDSALLYLCRLIDKPLHNMGVTPNMITFFGLLTGVLSIYFFIHKKFVLSFCFLWFTYFTDCLDGYVARKYNQTSKLGDYLDHFRDQFIVLSLAVLLTIHISSVKNRILFVFVITIFAVLMFSQLGCQERISHYNHHNECLHFLSKLCPGNATENIKWTRWFGCGTFYLVLSLFVLCMK